MPELQLIANKAILKSEAEIKDAFTSGKTVYWRSEHNHVVFTTNSYKVKHQVNREKYLITPLDKLIDAYGIKDDFYTLGGNHAQKRTDI